MAWFTPLTDPWAGLSLSAIVISSLTCAAIVAALPAGMAIWARLHRMAVSSARRMRQVSADVDRWIEEDAPRPSGPA